MWGLVHLGSEGTIRTFGDSKSWVMHVVCRSIRHWTATKEALGVLMQAEQGQDCPRRRAEDGVQRVAAVSFATFPMSTNCTQI